MEELTEVLRRLHDCDPEMPICVSVAIPHYQIHIGLGSDPTFLIVDVEPFDGEYYISVGETEAVGYKDFYGCGNHTPFDTRNFIPFEPALAAVCEFVADQKRSVNIAWENWDREPV